MADLSPRLSGLERRLKAYPLYAPAQKAGLDNPAWDEASSRILILRLSPFRDAARSTGHLFLQRLVRDSLGPSAYVDFSFFPSKPDRALLEEAGVPFIHGVAARRSLEEYDAVLVSCSYAMELPNLPYLLLKSGVPLRSSERAKSDAWPPVVLGGSNAFASQGLIFPDGDSFADGVFFGEGEDGGAALVQALAVRGVPVRERLEAAEKACPAFWAAGFGAPGATRPDGSIRTVRAGRSAVDAQTTPLILDRYVLLNSEEASTARLQISWGCPSFCSFCFEGWERKPYRELPRAKVLETARSLKARSGASTADLYSFNFNAHEDALSLMLDLNKVFDRVNMMSQRADLLIGVPGMVACELAAEKRSFTVGVEGISARMRAYYCKGLEDGELDALLRRLVKEKVRELKLFFILAGIEDEADQADFGRFCARLRDAIDAEHSSTRVLFSFGFLVRMPWTPLRSEALVLDRRRFDAVAEKARASVENGRFEFRVAVDWDEYVADQLLVAGGHALAFGLEKAASEGCAYDLRVEGPLAARLSEALAEAGELDASSAAGKTFSGPLVDAKASGWNYPLAFARREDEGAVLERAAGDARAGTDRGGCLGDFDGACLACGACADAEERRFLTGHKVKPDSAGRLAREIEELVKSKRRARPIYVQARLPDSLAGAEDEFLAAWLLRLLASASPILAPKLLRAEEALRSAPAWRDRFPGGAVGECVLALHGDSANGGLDAEAAEEAVRVLGEALGSPARRLDAAAALEPAGVDFSLDFEGTSPDGAVAKTRKWLLGLKLAFTERKTATGRVFEIAPKDRKKRIVEEVVLDGLRLSVRGGPKLDLSGLSPRGEVPGFLRVEALRR